MAVIVNAIHRRSERQRGQALVETALSMLIVLVLLAGMVDLGFALGARVAVSSASREGARFGSRYPENDAAIVAAARGALPNTLVPALQATVTISPTLPSGRTQWHDLEVSVRYNYQPFLGNLFGISGTIPMTATTTMVISGGPN